MPSCYPKSTTSQFKTSTSCQQACALSADMMKLIGSWLTPRDLRPYETTLMSWYWSTRVRRDMLRAVKLLSTSARENVWQVSVNTPLPKDRETAKSCTRLFKHVTIDKAILREITEEIVLRAMLKDCGSDLTLTKQDYDYVILIHSRYVAEIPSPCVFRWVQHMSNEGAKHTFLNGINKQVLDALKTRGDYSKAYIEFYADDMTWTQDDSRKCLKIDIEFYCNAY